MKFEDVKKLGLVITLMNMSYESPKVKVNLQKLITMSYDELETEYRNAAAADKNIFDGMIKASVSENFDGPFNDEAEAYLVKQTNAFIDFFSYSEALTCLSKVFEGTTIPEEMKKDLVESYTKPFDVITYGRRNAAIGRVLNSFKS